MSNRSRWVMLCALSGLLVLGYFAYGAFRTAPVVPVTPGAPAGKPAGGAPGGMALPVETLRLVPVDLALEAAAVGSLRSNESVVLRPEIAGRIALVGFKDGAAVAKGKLLVALESTTQTAELAQAQANLALARANQQRSQELFEKKFISQQSLDNTAAALKVQEAAVALAQARLEKTRILAPFSGVVGIRNISVGDYVKEGQELINLEDLSRMKIDFRLPESYLGQLKPGLTLEVTADALPGRRFRASLEAVNPLLDAGGRAIACLAYLDQAADLRPGMFVRVSLILERRANALMLPEQALMPDSKMPYVFRVHEGKAVRTPVKAGLRRAAQIEILEGLSAGDEVVTAGQLKLRDGAPVRNVAGGLPANAAMPAVGAAPAVPPAKAAAGQTQ